MGLLIKSEVDSKGEWQKQEIYNASPSKLVTYIGYNIKNWSFRFQSLQNFKQEDEFKNVIEGYNTSDLMVGYRFQFGKFNLGIQNLFNTDYQTIWSKRSQVLYSSYGMPALFNYKGRGRTFNLSYTFEF